MDPLVALVPLSILLGIALAWALVNLRRRDAEVRGLRSVLGTEPPADTRAAAQARVQPVAPGPNDREELLGIADQVGVGVVQLDDDLIVRLANRAVPRLFDRQTSPIGQSAIEAFGDHRIEELLERARVAGTAAGELTLHEPNQPTVRLVARRIPGRGLWLVLEDVSEIRRLQRIRSEFIDNLSHELRTPLTTVSLLVETLARESADQVPPRMRERILKVEVETGHLVQMVNELLDLSRIESEQQPPRLEELDLVQVARLTVERLRTFADRASVSLVMTAGDSVPPVRGDEERLGQVLVNLLHNAIKFSPQGTEVSVTVAYRAPEVVVSVTDHGIGVPKADQVRIFERFYKVDKARVRGGGAGTGLGLAIARHVVEAHGGRIWVESEEGTGSTFAFALPSLVTATAGSTS